MEIVFEGIYTSVHKTQKKIIEQVIVLEHKGRPCKMCHSVRQKLGHTSRRVIALRGQMALTNIVSVSVWFPQ